MGCNPTVDWRKRSPISDQAISGAPPYAVSGQMIPPYGCSGGVGGRDVTIANDDLAKQWDTVVKARALVIGYVAMPKSN